MPSQTEVRRSPYARTAGGRQEHAQRAALLPAYSTLTTINSPVPKACRAPILGVVKCPGEGLALLPKNPTQGRRACKRYPLDLEIRYTQSDRRGLPETGSGRIIDLSSSGLRFTAAGPLLAGLRIDVSIDWPALLDGGVQLQLSASGVVVWTNGTETALRIQRHEFRTRRAGVKVE